MTDYRRQQSGLRISRPVAVLAALLWLSACTTLDPDLQFEPDRQMTEQLIAQQQDRYPDLDPLALDPEIQRFLEAGVGRSGPARERLGKLQTLLFSSEGLDLQYDDQHTQTALEVYQSRAGNCLSVMNLYVAAARFLDIDASFQTAKVRPEWDRKGNLVVLSEHINATGKLGPFEEYVVDFTPDLALQQMTVRVVSDHLARAMYFNNLGVEAMIAGDYDGALAFLRNALWLQPDLAIAWNNIGTAFNRSGKPEAAEYSYQMSIYHEPDDASAIGNLARLYEVQGNSREAARLRRAIADFNRVNPYYQFELGNFALSDGQFEEAERYYRRAIKLDEFEPVFYVALANVYDLQGDARNQRKMLDVAVQLLEESQYIYVPSDQKVRIRDARTILNDASPSLRIAVGQ